MVVVTRRIGVELTLARPALAARPTITKNLSAVVAKSDLLAGSIALALKAGRRVVLLDVDYHSPLFGQDKTIAQSVAEELTRLGARPELAASVLNLDHHTPALNTRTSTELVLENLDRLQELDGEIEIVVTHGDTDSMISSFIAQNHDRQFSAEERALLIAAARAGDHTEGDFLATPERLTNAVKLCLMLDALAIVHKLEYRKIWALADAEIEQGMAAAYRLISSALQDQRTFFLPDNVTLMEKNPVRYSYSLVAEALRGESVRGVTVDSSVPGFPIVTVDVSTPGLDDFNPLPAYQAQPAPAIILIVREGRTVGIGRNNSMASWLNLQGSSDRVEGFFNRTAMRLKGGAHAGGANVPRDAFDTLPSIEEGQALANQFLLDSLKTRS